MKEFIGMTVALVFWATANAAETVWAKWSIAPYASSFAEACRKAPSAIDATSMPQPVKEHFKKTLGPGCEGWSETWLTPKMQLSQMWSGGAKPHLMDNVAVGELPVLRSPDGRAYQKGAVAETARAAEWSYEYNGTRYHLYIPFVCHNIAWRSQPVETKLAEECVEIPFNAPVGSTVHWGVGSNHGPLKPSACNAQKQGDGAYTAWVGECSVIRQIVRDGKVVQLPECTADVDFIRRTLGENTTVPHRYTYKATAAQQTLRFAKEIQTGSVVYFCLEYPDKSSTCGVYMRPQDWKGRAVVPIPDQLWVKNTGDNCPK